MADSALCKTGLANICTDIPEMGQSAIQFTVGQVEIQLTDAAVSKFT